uniref:Uncharacterized protein n=1 Tax=Oryza rufipogon TaxID=4529 RepID=A0A0E0Q3M0_ORYRU
MTVWRQRLSGGNKLWQLNKGCVVGIGCSSNVRLAPHKNTFRKDEKPCGAEEAGLAEAKPEIEQSILATPLQRKKGGIKKIRDRKKKERGRKKERKKKAKAQQRQMHGRR